MSLRRFKWAICLNISQGSFPFFLIISSPYSWTLGVQLCSSVGAGAAYPHWIQLWASACTRLPLSTLLPLPQLSQIAPPPFTSLHLFPTRTYRISELATQKWPALLRSVILTLCLSLSSPLKPIHCLRPPASSPAFPPSLPLLLIADLYAGCDLGGYKAPHIILDHSSAPREASYEERSLNDALTINSVLCPNVSLVLLTKRSNIDTRTRGNYCNKIFVKYT